MTLSEPKKLYSRFLAGHKGVLHFAAHSHHFWPDVSREAHLSYWDDCALMSDEKWGKIFENILPTTQAHIARLLNLKESKRIVFAPNTHELTTRLLSLFLGKAGLRLLTTSSEFHSWKRQIQRLQELPEFKVTAVPTETLLTDRRAFIEALKTELKLQPDIFFISQVFFDSGIALSMDELIELTKAAPKETLVVIDGYHAFAAVPTDLSKLEGRVFYVGGGYKYAQAGEGVGFMVIPKGDWRPAYTGWFAEYAHLSKPAGALVGYSQDYMAFMGATQDPSGLYRFNAVWNLFSSLGMNTKSIHEYVLALQKTFLKIIDPGFLTAYDLIPLFSSELQNQGHFLAYEAGTIDLAESCQSDLKAAGVLIDRRGARLRFGFGLYHDAHDVALLGERLKKLATK